ncbi:competence protein ComEA [Micromonospora pattaloongensis]|uniref:Competence protein ComEA n=1 Tax=Micromonospora pattaloongensis TaxID=405436 RepID=A0A1H3RL03_9ACTN|nr:ComEA family DNA-binding protein [Micromonospora pattaloongensis]SDZ26387.1 competence protein ComEA [Micromonospora pattaloongensis]
MPDDDETLVRDRLIRLTAGTPALPPLLRSAGPPSTAGEAETYAEDRAVGPAAERPGAPAAPLPLPSRLNGLGAFDPGRPGVKALAVVAAVVVVGAGVFAWRSRPRVEPVADARPDVTTAASAAPSAPAAATEGAVVVVAVAGRVRRPGLVRVPAGARVADVLDAAGGALPGTDVALLNLARKVTDGELILVGVTAPPGAAVPGAGGPGEAVPGAPGGPGGGKVNLNTATVAQLDALPGVGPVLAQRILDHRARHGAFRSVGDLRQVDGIGDARFEQLRELVTV